ncbi:MAG: DUF1566 domain-containing protein [Sphingomonadales bacterium]|nr:DUF1566 domain-containing protein [Sphingomonadales bacterium]
MCIQFAYKRPQKIPSRSVDSATKRSIFGKAKPIAMKYAVLLLALVFAGCEGGESSNDGGYEIKIDGSTIQVAKEDFPETMDWDDAMAACQNLGNGWRLPSIDELRAMNKQLYLKGKGNFHSTWYWSSSEYNEEQGIMWTFAFGDGEADDEHHSLYPGDGLYGDGTDENHYTKHVRAVRTLPSMAQKPKPKGQVPQKLTFEFKGQTIEVAKKDFTNEMTWHDAMTACKNLGNGWRLPSDDELRAMYKQLHKKGKGGFRTDVWYWSSSEYDANSAWTFYFEDGSAANHNYYHSYEGSEYITILVRAVRTLP